MSQVFPEDFRPFAKMAMRHYSSPVKNGVVLVIEGENTAIANDYAEGNKDGVVYSYGFQGGKKLKKNVKEIVSFDEIEEEMIDIIHIASGDIDLTGIYPEKFNSSGALVIDNVFSLNPELIDFYTAWTNLDPTLVYKFALASGNGGGVATRSREFTDRVLSEKFKAIPYPGVSHAWVLKLFTYYLKDKQANTPNE